MTNKYIYLVFALLLAMLYFAVPHYYNLKFSDDSILYDGIAKAITKGESNISTPGYFEDGNDIGQTVMPGYPAIIAVVYSMLGTNAVNVIVLQIFVSLVAIWVFFLISNEIFSRYWAIGYTFFYAAYVIQWSYSLLLLIESFTISILIFSLYYLIKFIKTNKLSYFVAYSFLFGLLICLNNRFIVHFGFVGLYFLFNSLRSIKLVDFKKVLTFGLIIIAILTPWHIRQYQHWGKFVIFTPERTANVNQKTTTQGYSEKKAYYGYVPGYDTVINLYMTQYLTKQFRKESREYIESKFTLQKYNELKDNYKSFGKWKEFKSRAWGFFEVIRIDYRFGFAGDMRIAEPSFYDKPTSPLFLFDLVDFALLGLAFLGFIPAIYFSYLRANIFIQILLLYLIAHWLLHSYVGYLPRYRITIMPVIFLIGSYGINATIELFRNKLNSKL